MIEASPCDHRRLLGFGRYDTDRERCWFEKHEPWLWDQLEHNSSTGYAEEPAYVINCALGWLFERASMEERDPCWEQLDVRDLLLQELPMCSMPDYFGSRDVLAGLREFITWMGQQHKMAAATADRLAREVDACQEEFLDYFGDTAARELSSQTLEGTLASLDDPGQFWLHCLHCNRFFQAKDLRIDFIGNRQGCAFADCGAAGFDVDIHPWDTWRNNRDPRWPASPDQLRRGMEAPQGPPDSFKDLWEGPQSPGTDPGMLN